MSPLEQRYRRVLRLLPAYYRGVWEEDMVTAFLRRALPEVRQGATPDEEEDAQVAAEFGRPGAGDVARVVALAVRLRVGGPGASPRHHVWGAAVRRVALFGFLAHAVLAVLALGTIGLSTLWPPPVPDPSAGVTTIPPPAWSRVQDWATLLWVPAYLLLVGAHRRAAGTLAALAVLPSVVSLGWFVAAGDTEFLATPLCWLVVAVLTLLALVAFHPGTPPPRRGPWLAAFPIGLVLGAVLLVVLPWSLHSPWPVADSPALACLLVCAAGIAYLVARGTGGRRAGATWSTTLMLLGLGALTLRVATLLLGEPWWVSDSSLGRAVLVAGTVEAVTTLAVTAALAALARRALRSLPDTAAVG